MLDYTILMLVHPSSGDNKFYMVRDANHIVLIDLFGNEPKKENRDNYALIKNNSSLKFEIMAKQLYVASQRVL